MFGLRFSLEFLEFMNLFLWCARLDQQVLYADVVTTYRVHNETWMDQQIASVNSSGGCNRIFWAQSTTIGNLAMSAQLAPREDQRNYWTNCLYYQCPIDAYIASPIAAYDARASYSVTVSKNLVVGGLVDFIHWLRGINATTPAFTPGDIALMNCVINNDGDFGPCYFY